MDNFDQTQPKHAEQLGGTNAITKEDVAAQHAMQEAYNDAARAGTVDLDPEEPEPSRWPDQIGDMVLAELRRLYNWYDEQAADADWRADAQGTEESERDFLRSAAAEMADEAARGKWLRQQIEMLRDAA